MKQLKFFLGIAYTFISLITFAQAEVTVTIGYPDHESYFIYSIPYPEEEAKFGGEYYFKVENTGTVDLDNWEIHTFWKALNSTWGVVDKTVIDPVTGEIKLNGPSWDQTLSVGESFVLNGEWVPTGSIEDWVDFLPNTISMQANGTSVNVVYTTTGQVSIGNYNVQIVKPINDNRKTYANKKIVAYFPIFDKENAWCSLQRYGQNIDELRVQLYSINSNGTLRAGQDLPNNIDPINDIDYWYQVIDSLGVVDFCVQNNIQLVPVIYNYNSDINDFDQIGVHTMLSNPTKKAQHIADIEQLIVNHPEFSGIDVDYESLQAIDKDLYSSFMEDLSTMVHGKNKILTTAVHTKVGPGTWYGPQAQDYEKIGNAVDEFMIMTYDLHWATSPTYNNPPPTAGCQATPDWDNDVAFFAVSEIIDPSKIQIGIPFYGYRWKEGFENHTINDPGIGLTFSDAQALQQNYTIINSGRDPNGYDPYFTINISDTNWVCYYQDSISIEHKLMCLEEHDLKDYIGGVGIWRLGQESDEMWGALTNKLINTSPIINNEECNTGNNLSIESNETIQVSYFPNPFDNIVIIDFKQEVNAELVLRNSNGELIKKKRIQSNMATFEEFNTIAAGVYFLDVKYENNMEHTVIKLIKK